MEVKIIIKIPSKIPGTVREILVNFIDSGIKLKHVIKNPEVDHKMLTLPYRVDMLIEKLPK